MVKVEAGDKVWMIFKDDGHVEIFYSKEEAEAYKKANGGLLNGPYTPHGDFVAY